MADQPIQSRATIAHPSVPSGLGPPGLVLAAVVVSGLLGLGTTEVRAQSALAPSEIARSDLSLDVGLLRHGQSDLAASALRYAGTVPSGGLGYQRSLTESRFETVVELAAGMLGSRLTAGGVPREDAWLGRVGLRYLRAAGHARDGRVLLLLGGQVDAHALVRVHHYLENGTEVFADLLAPVQLAAGWDWEPPGGASKAAAASATAAAPSPFQVRVGQRLAVPVFGVALRTPYGGLKHLPAPRLAGPGAILGFDHELFVERRLSPRLGGRVGWTLRLLRHTEPRELRVAAHRLTVCGLLRLGGGG